MRNWERTALQVAVSAACLVPLAAGGAGMLSGPAMIGGEGALALDSHFRYLSGLLFGIGLGFLSTVPAIEAHGPRFRLLTVIVVAGGIGRLISVATLGVPQDAMAAALVMELIVTPALALWQSRIARNCSIVGP